MGSIKDFYYNLEGKWYDFLDKINTKIPIYKIIDPIDKIIPSFILLLIILLILIILIIFSLTNFFDFSYNTKITVLSTNNIPLSSTKLTIQNECDETIIEKYTDDLGISEFKICSKNFTITAEKKGYKKDTKNFTYNTENIIKLMPTPIQLAEEELIKIKIVNKNDEILLGASLIVTCDNNIIFSEKQTSLGFNVDLKNCNITQFKANDLGFKEKIINFNRNEKEIKITLEQDLQEGKVRFYTFNENNEEETNIEINLENFFGENQKTITDNSGHAIIQLKFENYNYTAYSPKTGESILGNFTIDNTNTKEIEIKFSQPKNTTHKTINPLIVSKNDNPVFSAEITLYRDKTIVTTNRTNTNGTLTTPFVISTNQLDKSYFILINADGYEKKILRVVPNDSNSNPFKVVLNQGENQLNVTIINDINSKISDAFVTLKNTNFGIKLDQGYTDKNGLFISKNLPQGEYEVTASTSTSDGSKKIEMDYNLIQELEIKLMTGTGNIRYNFFEQGTKIDVNIKVYTQNNESEILAFEGKTKNGSHITEKLKVNTKIKIEIVDENYFFTQTPIYSITRNNQTKEVYLVSKNNLPNNNPIQLFLENIYSSDPFYTTPSPTERILQGKKYYFYFNLLLNSDNYTSPIAVFFNNNFNDKNSTKIGGVKSTFNYQTIMDSNYNSHFVNPLSETLVDTNGKLSNTTFENLNDPKVIPLIVEIIIDENTTNESLQYIAYTDGGNKKSLLMNFNFETGKTFCIKKTVCPAFMFSNYLEINKEKKAYEEDLTLLIDEEYNLFTTVENSSDQDFPNIEMVLNVPKEKMSYGLFSEDKNEIRFPINLTPLGKSLEKKSTIIPIKPTLSFNILESAQKIVSDIDELKNLNNTMNQKLKFIIKNKEILEIITSPTTIHEKTTEPLFIIKTKYKGKSAISANWKAEKILDNGSKELLTSGKTDIDGQEMIAFNATNLTKGDKILFTAYDGNGSIEGTKEIIVSSGFNSPEIIPGECLVVKKESTNLTTSKDFFLNLEINTSESITIESDCNVPRIVKIKTDLLTETDLIIQPNSTKNFSITAKSRGQLLGAYPIQIISIKDSRYSQLAYFDIVISDPSSDFSLDQAIFNFTNTDQITSKITNKEYSGRKDNFYPKASISTKSVDINYNKPGNPKEITFDLTIGAAGVEAALGAYGWGTVWKQRYKSSVWFRPNESKIPYIYPNTVPGTLYYLPEKTTEFEEKLEELIEDLTVVEDSEWFITPDIPELDPNFSWYEMPKEIQDKVISSVYPEEGSSGSLANENIKLKTISFAGAASCADDGTGRFVCPLGGCKSSNERNCNQCCVNKYFEQNPTDGPNAPVVDYNTLATNKSCSTQGIKSSPLPGSYSLDDEEGFCSFNYYPEVIGDYVNTPLQNYDGNHEMQWVSTLVRPEGWREAHQGNTYVAFDEESKGDAVLIRTGDCGSQGCKIIALEKVKEGLQEKGVFGLLRTSRGRSDITLQPEMYRTFVYEIKREIFWTKKFTVPVVEGKVTSLGPYDIGMPTPEWVGTYNDLEDKIGEPYTEDDVSIVILGAEGIGFIDIRKTMEEYLGPGEKGKPVSAPHPTHPWIEYSPDGYIQYGILPGTIPDGFRMFLKNGNVYAEYIGNVKVDWDPSGADQMVYIRTEPSISSPNIDFTLTKVNLIGTEYAIITVQDWINDTEKKEGIFQVKLKGPETSCISSSGEEGHTGAEFVPKLLFSWDWQTLSQDQCDFSNSSHTYCDGVQFNISLFKKILSFEELISKGKMSDLATKSSFYSYLIKDNYSTNLLNDFAEYYSSELTTAPAYFSSTNGYKKFIEEGKLQYRFRNQNGTFTDTTTLPYGGFYRVEIDINRIDKSLFSLFDGNNLNAQITVTLMPVEKAPNYNPFYETPFDGEVGKKGETYERNDYGTTFNGNTISINNATNKIISRNYTGNPIKTINTTTLLNFPSLKNGIILNYNTNQNTISFNPSKPTPLTMTITNPALAKTLNAVYELKELSGSTNVSNYSNLTNNWVLTNSNIPGSKESCLDFEENNKRWFTDTKIDDTKRLISWNNAVKGNITLSTIIFAPEQTSPGIVAIPANENIVSLNGPTKINTYIPITNYNLEDTLQYDNLEFVFNQIKEEKMCMTKNNETNLNIWWNPEYLAELIKEISTKNNCKLDVYTPIN